MTAITTQAQPTIAKITNLKSKSVIVTTKRSNPLTNWCVKPVFIKAPSGRQRLNVLGALEAVSHRLITVSNEAYITTASLCELLGLIAAEAAGRPVTIILDNARYQHCAMVQSRAHELNLELAFLPSYSPNLNLIERLWKFVKKQCLYSEYYASAWHRPTSDTNRTWTRC